MRRHSTKESLLAFWTGFKKGLMRRHSTENARWHSTKNGFIAILMGLLISAYIDNWGWPLLGLVAVATSIMMFIEWRDERVDKPPTNEESDSHDSRIT